MSWSGHHGFSVRLLDDRPGGEEHFTDDAGLATTEWRARRTFRQIVEIPAFLLGPVRLPAGRQVCFGGLLGERSEVRLIPLAAAVEVNYIVGFVHSREPKNAIGRFIVSWPGHHQVATAGIEPALSRGTGATTRRACQPCPTSPSNRGGRDRTDDFLFPKQVAYLLPTPRSYSAGCVNDRDPARRDTDTAVVGCAS